MIFKRKDVKSHGTKKVLEGHFQKGDRCLIVEDVVVYGESILETKNVNDLTLKLHREPAESNF